MTINTKRLRELASWYDETRGDAGYLFSGERGEASKAWHRAVTTQTVITLLDEHASVCRQRDRLMHERDTALTRAEASEGKLVAMTAARDEAIAQLAAMTAARDKACEIAEGLCKYTHAPRVPAMLAELRKVGT